MKYCNRCLYPENAKPVITFDEYGICSGCRYVESRKSINWNERSSKLKDLIQDYKVDARKRGNYYDCIIPVSGGKDSTYQVYYVLNELKINPLLVTFNHSFNTKVGLRNLENLVEKSGCDLIRFTANRTSSRKLSKYFLEKIGDITWHYHAGIMTFPFQISVKYNIPLLIFGEEGYSELTGMYNQDDMIEHTKMRRVEHDMRGYEPENFNFTNTDLKPIDFAPYVYPTDEQLETVGTRGIFLSNYINWSAKEQTEIIIKEWGFEPLENERERTFNMYDKSDDAANGTHDYLKYLKFGYGRATDDASTEIRHGRMTREEGIIKVLKHDPARPKDLDFMLKFLNIDEDYFEKCIESMRDTGIWKKNNGKWETITDISKYNNKLIEKCRVQQSKNRTSYFKPQKKPNVEIPYDFKIL
jgi:N-acetyl sugar amidotransferase